MLSSVRDMTRCALFSALLCVCGWISFPLADVSITMQTFGVFLTLAVLGGKHGFVACLGYLLLGAVGLPVFSGFRGGLGILLGPTGGYLWGFLAAALIYWFIDELPIAAGWRCPAAMVAGLLGCYGCGTVWYLLSYAGSDSLVAVLGKCVLPFLLPDILKLAAAWSLSGRLRRFL